MKQIVAGLIVLVLSGCASYPRVVTRKPWERPFNSDISISNNTRTLLVISGDGSIWKWNGSAEDTVEALIGAVYECYAEKVKVAAEGALKSLDKPKKAAK